MIVGNRCCCCCCRREQCCSCSRCWSRCFGPALGSVATDRSRRRTWSEGSFLKHFFVGARTSCSLECHRVSGAREPLPSGSHLHTLRANCARARSKNEEEPRESWKLTLLEHDNNNNDDRHELPTKVCRFNQFVGGPLRHTRANKGAQTDKLALTGAVVRATCLEGPRIIQQTGRPREPNRKDRRPAL